ncbi:MAG: PepSY domain-containing protein [Carnobacterium sp.]|uniref:PepSY domain-containing protein n=1 Tax=unclassified Carnobacterium TaxID=257487 RepID=UPI0019144EDB|nr:PepSY domain-containing protein [Carnobacterium sp. CS13]QQP69688.1 PepSY domain-containing protein [Carnobacterium sp. CS13]
MKTGMSKKALIGATTLATSLVLAACSSGNQEDTTTTPSEASSEMMMSSDQMDSSSMMSSDSSSSMSSSSSTADSSSSSSSNTDASSKGIENKTFDVSMEDAVNKFKDEYSDAEITSVSIDEDSNNYVYKVEGYNATNEVELEVDATTGEVMNKDTDDKDNVDDDEVLDLAGLVSPQEAMKAALDKVGSGYAKEWGIDSKNGTIYYEIDVEGSDSANDDVHIDAKTGEFLEFD